VPLVVTSSAVRSSTRAAAALSPLGWPMIRHPAGRLPGAAASKSSRSKAGAAITGCGGGLVATAALGDPGRGGAAREPHAAIIAKLITTALRMAVRCHTRADRRASIRWQKPPTCSARVPVRSGAALGPQPPYSSSGSGTDEATGTSGGDGGDAHHGARAGHAGNASPRCVARAAMPVAIVVPAVSHVVREVRSRWTLRRSISLVFSRHGTVVDSVGPRRA